MRFVFTALASLLLFSSFISATKDPATVLTTLYNINGDERITIILVAGWNMVPDGALSVGTCDNNEIAYGTYRYSPVRNSYLGLGNSKDDNNIMQSETDQKYYHAQFLWQLGSRWMYSSKPCSITERIEKNMMINGKRLDFSTLKVKAGWNFLSIHPWMVGRSWKDILSKCSISKVQLWDETTQNWLFPYQIPDGGVITSSDYANLAVNSNAPLKENQIGAPILFKFNSDCYLSGTSSISPPGIPQ